MSGIYNIIIVVFAVVGLVRGWRQGFLWQVASILGMAFGVVAANIFSEDASALVIQLFPGLEDAIAGRFISTTLGTAAIYIGVFALFRMLANIFRSAMQVLQVGALNSILGAAFCAVKYLIVISIVYNLIICVNPGSQLMHYADHDDGNIVQGVLFLAPSILGGEDIAELSHRMQLLEAKKISMLEPGTTHSDQTLTLYA